MDTTNFPYADAYAASAHLREENQTPQPEQDQTTRERSPRKPSDFKASIKKPANVTFRGEEYTFDRRAPKHVPNYFKMRSGDFEGFLTEVIGEKALERALESLTDEDGFSDIEDLGELVNEIYEAADAKNS